VEEYAVLFFLHFVKINCADTVAVDGAEDFQDNVFDFSCFFVWFRCQDFLASVVLACNSLQVHIRVVAVKLD